MCISVLLSNGTISSPTVGWGLAPALPLPVQIRERTIMLSKTDMHIPFDLLISESHGGENKKRPRNQRAQCAYENIILALFGGKDDITDELFEKVKAFSDFVCNREKSKKDKATPHNGARRFGERFWPDRRYGKRRNTGCISHFPYCTIG